ncbi:MAG: pilus assembly protein N-terminal domain-containing protein [Candidatus Omnitrophica bacterium]|nr:pilus assembly protein N-terminal domain-containing protein [Candidatus Omnitrophota bacterium]
MGCCLRLAALALLVGLSVSAPAGAQQPANLPPLLTLPPAILLGAGQEAIDVPYQQTILLQAPGVTRVLSVNPAVVEATLTAPGLVALRAVAFGQTFLHLWAGSERTTRALRVVQPIPPPSPLEQQRQVEAERAKHLTFEYANRFRTFRRGSSLGDIDLNTTTLFDHTLTGQMDTPHGHLGGRVAFQRVNSASDLTSWSAGITDGTAGPLAPFDLLGGDSGVGYSDFTLPHGTIRGVQIRSRAFDPYRAETFYGRRQLGFAAGLSPSSDVADDVFLAGGRLQDVSRPWTWHLAYGAASGSDRVDVQTNQAMEAGSWLWPNETFGIGAQVGRTQEDASAYRLMSSLRGGVWNLDTTYRNFSQRYENLLGRSPEQGERGVLMMSRYAPLRTLRLRQRLDLYQDTLFANPQEPGTLNLDLELGADVDLTRSTQWTSSYGRQRLLGRLFPTDTTSLSTLLRQRLGAFPLVGQGTAFGQYLFRDLRSVNVPASDFESHTIQLGLGAPLAQHLYWQVTQQWTWLQETFTGEDSVPRQTAAGLQYSQHMHRLPLLLRGGFHFSRASNAESPNSFLADEIRYLWDAGLRYDLSPATQVFLDGRLQRRAPQGAGREYEINLETGVRHLFDTGFSWQPSASLSGIVFQDADGDGRWQPAERGLPRVTVRAGALREAVTDPGGRFYLGRVRGTQVGVSVDLGTVPQGWVPTRPTTVEVDLAHPPPSLLFGFVPQSELRVRVFVDANGNGRYDATDVPLEAIGISLSDGTLARTDRAGWVFFRGIAPGDYTVTLAVQDLALGYAPVTRPSLAGSVREGDAAVVDFPILAQRAISGRVYVDRNRNAVWDQEPGIEGVAVCLDGVRRATTREDGRYLLKDVGAGRHRVELNCGALTPGYLPLNATVQTVELSPMAAQLERVDFRLGEQAALMQDITADVLRARRERDALVNEMIRAHGGQPPSGTGPEVTIEVLVEVQRERE